MLSKKQDVKMAASYPSGGKPPRTARQRQRPWTFKDAGGIMIYVASVVMDQRDFSRRKSDTLLFKKDRGRKGFHGSTKLQVMDISLVTNALASLSSSSRSDSHTACSKDEAT